MTGRFKCLTCSRIISDKYIHTRRTDPPHQKYIRIGTEAEEELSPTQKWTNEILSDELAGMKRVMLKLETHHAIQELSIERSGATYDDIILMCINSYHREKENNFNGNDLLESIVTNDSEEET